MDVNAGLLLDGAQSMDELGRATLRLMLDVASGRRSKGERAGHAQVQLWRNWPQPGTAVPAMLPGQPMAEGPQQAAGQATLAAPEVELLPTLSAEDGAGFAADRVALILPTSLCSSAVALQFAEELGEEVAANGRVTRLVAVAHSEGCGSSGGASVDMFARLLVNYACHPAVAAVVWLEHGCERNHGDFFRQQLQQAGVPAARQSRFGFASIQLDGGIAKARQRVGGELRRLLGLLPPPPLNRQRVGAGALRVGMVAPTQLDPADATVLAAVAAALLAAGGTVVGIGGGMQAVLSSGRASEASALTETLACEWGLGDMHRLDFSFGCVLTIRTFNQGASRRAWRASM